MTESRDRIEKFLHQWRVTNRRFNTIASVPFDDFPARSVELLVSDLQALLDCTEREIREQK